MTSLMGNSPRHPGLWSNLDDPLSNQLQNSSISSIVSQTQGLDELIHASKQLASLSHQGQWIVLINPANIGYKKLLRDAGVRMDRILLVHSKDDVETLWAMEKALTSGTCSAVLCWTPSLDARDKRRLQIVAKSARAIGIVIEIENENEAPLIHSAPRQDRCSHTQPRGQYPINHSEPQHSLFAALH